MTLKERIEKIEEWIDQQKNNDENVEEYKGTDYIKRLWIQMEAARELRDKYLYRENYKKSLKAAIDLKKFSVEMWEEIFDLYPFMKYENYKYYPLGNKIKRIEK